MGFWSWAADKFKQAKDFIKGTAKTVYEVSKKIVKKTADVATDLLTNPIDTIKDGCEKIWAGAKKVYDNASGNKAKRIAEEARSIYENGRAKYDAFVKQYEKRMDILNIQMCEIIDAVNQKKEYIIDVLFKRLQLVLSKIKYEKRFEKEYIGKDMPKITKIQLRNDILKIDFRKNPIKSRLKAFITLGLWANKEARESLDEAKGEVKKMEYAMSQMQAEEERYNLIKVVLENHLHYITEMIDIYERILFKANNSASFLRFKCIQFTHTVKEKYCKLESLPVVDQNLLYGLFNMSKILNTVAKMRLLATSDSNEINKYNAELEKNRNAFMAEVA